MCVAVVTIAFNNGSTTETYNRLYYNRLYNWEKANEALVNDVKKADLQDSTVVAQCLAQLQTVRKQMKQIDFWTRYLEPNKYKKINGPLPIEWETEVHEKWEKPYKHVGSGLTLAYQYLQEKEINKDTLLHL